MAQPGFCTRSRSDGASVVDRGPSSEQAGLWEGEDHTRLPDDLMRAVKIRAAQENRKLKDLVADLLRRGLAQRGETLAGGARVRLPLVQTAHAANPDAQMNPDRVAQVLLDEEAQRASGA
jgi:plasmid stability protein